MRAQQRPGRAQQLVERVDVGGLDRERQVRGREAQQRELGAARADASQRAALLDGHPVAGGRVLGPVLAPALRDSGQRHAVAGDVDGRVREPSLVLDGPGGAAALDTQIVAGAEQVLIDARFDAPAIGEAPQLAVADRSGHEPAQLERQHALSVTCARPR
ncbi:MAG TPA: hypothetical protein VM869_28485 [Enhygromyxa sp.]|nr:hypothetical protein [Enhygromyxa sp.]